LNLFDEWPDVPDAPQDVERHFEEMTRMKNLFVGNMSFQTTESELQQLFEAYGEVTRVQVMTDRDTGRARGFAFVEMANDEDAAKAIAALNGKDFGGRQLNVNEARPKPDRGGPRGGGGGRGGGGKFSRDDYRGSARQPREPRW
jgi:RNA recognition motif-containing protein